MYTPSPQGRTSARIHPCCVFDLICLVLFANSFLVFFFGKLLTLLYPIPYLIQGFRPLIFHPALTRIVFYY